MSDFDIIDNIPNEYFYRHFPKQRRFTLHLGMDKANFFLYFNHGDQFELKHLNDLHKEWKGDGWSNFVFFVHTKAESWSNYNSMLIFTCRKL